MAVEVRPMMVGDRMTRQQAVARGKGDIQNYMDAGISSLEMLPMYMTGTEDAVNDALRISRSTANEQNYTDDDRTEDTLRHILLGGLIEVGKDESIFGAKNFMGTGIGSKIASKLIDARETSSLESKIDLINNEFGRQLRKNFPDREKFIQEAIKVAQEMYEGKDVTPINDVAPALSYGATTPPEQAEGGIMMAQQGQAVLPVTEATSAPQGGGPKPANPAAKPTLAPPPTKAPRPGSQDPRDAAVQEVAQEMQADKASAPTPAPQPVQQPMQPVGGLAAPQQLPAVPMMAKGGTTDEKSEGLAVMIGLGAPTPSYEKAAEGNPPPGATKEEVADDQLVLLSEGELVVPANVVRYHGLGTYEGMRREALMGLQDMEQSGQIEYVSGGKEKADKIDDNGGIVKAQAGTYLAPPFDQSINTFNPQIGLNYSVPATYRPTTLAAPVAASSQFVKTPGQQTIPQVPSALGMTGNVRALNTTNPLLLPYTPVIPSSVTGVYAPNVGQYKTAMDSGTTPTTPETPTVPTPTTPTPPPPRDEGGGDGRETPEAMAAQAERDGRIQDRKDAAAQLGYTNQVGILEGFAGALGYGTPEIGTVMADGTIADGYGNTFDPITGNQVGFKGGIVGNVLGNLGIMSPEMPEDMAANMPASSFVGLRSLAGEQSMANVLAELGTPPSRIAELLPSAPQPGMMSPTVDELSTQTPMDSALAAPTVATPTLQDIDDAIAGYNESLGVFNSGAFTAEQLADIVSGATSVTGLGVPNMSYDYSKSPNPNLAEQEQLAAATALNNMNLPTAINPATGAPIATPTPKSSITQAQMDSLGLTSPSTSMDSESLAEAAQARRDSYNSRVNDRIAEIEATGKTSSYAANKAKADIQAQDQTGNPNAQAVTTEDGKAVTSTNPDGTKSVVTSGNPGGTNKGGSKSNQGPSFDDSSLGKGSSGGSIDSQTQGPSFDDSSLGKDSGGTGKGGCVIATHAVANGGFSPDVKREAVRWCVKNLHHKWYGEAIRRGYRYHGNKAIEAGRAHNHYEEFKDYVDFATGKKRNFKNLGTFVYRTAQFFITGLFV